MRECGEIRHNCNWEVVDMFWQEVDVKFFFCVLSGQLIKLCPCQPNFVAIAGHSIKYIDRGLSIKTVPTVANYYTRDE